MPQLPKVRSVVFGTHGPFEGYTGTIASKFSIWSFGSYVPMLLYLQLVIIIEFPYMMVRSAALNYSVCGDDPKLVIRSKATTVKDHGENEKIICKDKRRKRFIFCIIL